MPCSAKTAATASSNGQQRQPAAASIRSRSSFSSKDGSWPELGSCARGVAAGAPLAVPPELMTSARHDGWLSMTASEDGNQWRRHWCILSASSLIAYSDKSSADEVPASRIIQLEQHTRICSFDTPEALGDCARHHHEHPYGFVICVQPNMDPERIFFYFDAHDSESHIAWMSALTNVVQTLPEFECASIPPGVSHAEVEETAMDDFSDYEDDSQERRSTLVFRHQQDWTAPGTLPVRPLNRMSGRNSRMSKGSPCIPTSYDIDGFSDYDDEEVAKTSSLARWHDLDWAEPSTVATAELVSGEETASGQVSVVADQMPGAAC